MYRSKIKATNIIVNGGLRRIGTTFSAGGAEIKPRYESYTEDIALESDQVLTSWRDRKQDIRYRAICNFGHVLVMQEDLSDKSSTQAIFDINCEGNFIPYMVGRPSGFVIYGKLNEGHWYLTHKNTYMYVHYRYNIVRTCGHCAIGILIDRDLRHKVYWHIGGAEPIMVGEFTAQKPAHDIIMLTWFVFYIKPLNNIMYIA
jgi:hypothetical protein